MATPLLAPEQIAQLSELVAQYITGMRARYAAASKPLTEEQKRTMAAYFSQELLDQARLLTLAGERVPNPDFYPMLVVMGFTNLPDQSGMAAITFSDVVVSHVPFSDALLFHELAHVEQYRQLHSSLCRTICPWISHRGRLRSNSSGTQCIPTWRRV
jgi:hypothetical protein